MRPFDARTRSSVEGTLMAGLRALRDARARGEVDDDELDRRIDALVPSMPLKVQVQTTTRCNAACAMCPYPEITGEPGFAHNLMSQDRYGRLLEQLAGGAVERLSLFLMNEPLLDKRLPDWVALARRALPDTRLGLFSNGSALTPSKAVALAQAGLDELCVSVHGLDEETYSRVMQGLSFERAMRNVNGLLDLRDQRALGDMHVQLVAGDLSEVSASVARGSERLRAALLPKSFSNERSAAAVAADLPSSERVGDALDAPICQRPFVKLYVMTDGTCVLCNVDWRRTVVAGTVGGPGPDQTVEAVWKGDAYRRIRRDHVLATIPADSICGRCDYPEVAGG